MIAVHYAVELRGGQFLEVRGLELKQAASDRLIEVEVLLVKESLQSLDLNEREALARHHCAKLLVRADLQALN